MGKNGKKSGQSFVRQFGVKPLLQATVVGKLNANLKSKRNMGRTSLFLGTMILVKQSIKKSLTSQDPDRLAQPRFPPPIPLFRLPCVRQRFRIC